MVRWPGMFAYTYPKSKEYLWLDLYKRAPEFGAGETVVIGPIIPPDQCVYIKPVLK